MANTAAPARAAVLAEAKPVTRLALKPWCATSTGVSGPAGVVGNVRTNGTCSRGPATIWPSSSRNAVPMSVPAPVRTRGATKYPVMTSAIDSCAMERVPAEPAAGGTSIPGRSSLGIPSSSSISSRASHAFDDDFERRTALHGRAQDPGRPPATSSVVNAASATMRARPMPICSSSSSAGASRRARARLPDRSRCSRLAHLAKHLGRAEHRAVGAHGRPSSVRPHSAGSGAARCRAPA